MDADLKEKQQLFRQLKKLVESRFKKEEAKQFASFIESYFRDVSLDDLKEREIEDLYGAAIAHWNFAFDREENTSNIHVYNPTFDVHGWQSPFTVIEVVTEDCPFLVNSITMNLNSAGHTYHLVVHPVLNVTRNKKGELTSIDAKKGGSRESFIRIEIDKQNTNKKIKDIDKLVNKVLSFNKAVVEDWSTCAERLSQAATELKKNDAQYGEENIGDSIDFLKWLAQDNFLLLGCREYKFVGNKKGGAFKIIPGSGAGILRDELAEIPASDQLPLSENVCAFMSEPCPLVVTKATSRSIVHRPVYMDYIGVKRVDQSGKIIGEIRFLGLYTSTAYHMSVLDIPLLKNKVQKVFEKSGFLDRSHSLKSLQNVLEGLPRDEIFHSNDEQLFDLAMGVMRLRERQRIRLFARQDIYGQFVTLLVYVPRDHYNTEVRRKMERLIAKSVNARSIEFDVEFSESILARVHFTVYADEHGMQCFDEKVLEAEIIEALRDWKDDLSEALKSHFGESQGVSYFNQYGDGFSAAYRENYPVRFAVSDIERIQTINEFPDNIQMTLYQPLEAHGEKLQFKLMNEGEPAPLSQTLPVLENMGVTVFDERPFEIRDIDTAKSYWLHDFGLVTTSDFSDFESTKAKFQTVFEKVWAGEIDNDGFNQLVLKANLDWREIMLFRAYYMYLRQAGAAFSQTYVEQTLINNCEITKQLSAFFELKFKPNLKGRETKLAQQEAEILAAIEQVSSLDEDRILRRYLNLIQSTLRTNYFLEATDDLGIPYLAFKFDPSCISELPSPRPTFEIFVFSSRVEGVHLRGGSVARGGLRWSDRREDFRTEILGLMKAQVSKNAVIVPSGAKGGFIVKSSLEGFSRDQVSHEVVGCYSVFIGALLDITDNLVGEKIVPPENVVRHDGDDPYLVVAADKGTATFSDIANGIAIDRGFWLGDAFASGGSVGYDHKKMGITAKGAWESVKRHFREMGIDTQSTPFSVVGIGDMGGDVFGNGMLLSEHIRLVGAFNHMHIFIDPDPNPAKSFKERQRMFELPRSTWEDYNKTLISKGGGVFSRAEKSIKLTPEIKKLLAVEEDSLTPNELIQAMLKAPVDLLWNGGIGTYVKSTQETNDMVGDRANDALRVNGCDLRCKVVGEGGNLGFTQRGRIEYAKRGRINTDSIDNAAGVDCSDHEVNIKILLNKLVEQGDMTMKQRNAMLAKMTDEVSELVLRNNYLQTQAITMIENQSVQMLDVHARLIDHLSQNGPLDREVEFLPNSEEIEERKAAGKGLTRPELAVVFAYSKLLLKDILATAPILQDDVLKHNLEAYFPGDLTSGFLKAVHGHRLRDEIIVNELVNQMVNRLGPSFAFRMADEAGASIEEVMKNYKIACDIFNVNQLWNDIEALDNQVMPAVQNQMLMEVRKLIERTMFWLQRNRFHIDSISNVVKEFETGMKDVCAVVNKQSSALIKEKAQATTDNLISEGVPKNLAQKISALEVEFSSLDILAVHSQTNVKKDDLATAYFAITNALGIDWLNESINQLPRKNYWQSLARSALRDDLYGEKRALLATVYANKKASNNNAQAIKQWLEKNAIEIERYLKLVSIVQSEGQIAIEQLSVLLKELHAISERNVM